MAGKDISEEQSSQTVLPGSDGHSLGTLLLEHQTTVPAASLADDKQAQTLEVQSVAHERTIESGSEHFQTPGDAGKGDEVASLSGTGTAPKESEASKDSKSAYSVITVSQTLEEEPASSNEPGGNPLIKTKTQKALAILSLALGLGLYSLDTTMVATAIPSMVKDLGNEELLSWIGSAYLLSSTAMGPIFGKLSDIVGRKRLLVASTVLFILSSVICALAPNMIALIVGRALQGLGGGGVQSTVFILISDVVSLRERGTYQGIFSAITGGSAIFGPFLGGLITDSWSWRGCFWINIPVGFFALAGYFVFLRLPPPETKKFSEMVARIDWGGAVICVTAVVLFLLGLTYSESLGWSSVQCLGPLISGLVLVAVFCVYEWKVPREPNVPLRLFRTVNYSICCASMFFIGWIATAASYFLPLYFQLVLGNSPTQSGVKTIPWLAFYIPMSLICGTIASRTGVYTIFPKIGLALAAVALGLMSLWGMSTPLGEQIGFMALLGVGVGSSMSMVMLATQANLPLKDIGPGTTVATFMRAIGGTVAIGVSATVLQNVVGSALSPQAIASLAAQYGISPQQMAIIISNDINHVGNVPSSALPEAAITAGTVAVQDAYAQGISRVFLAMAPAAVIGWLIILFLRHTPLRGGAEKPSETKKVGSEAGESA